MVGDRHSEPHGNGEVQWGARKGPWCLVGPWERRCAGRDKNLLTPRPPSPTLARSSPSPWGAVCSSPVGQPLSQGFSLPPSQLLPYPTGKRFRNFLPLPSPLPMNVFTSLPNYIHSSFPPPLSGQCPKNSASLLCLTRGLAPYA